MAKKKKEKKRELKDVARTAGLILLLLGVLLAVANGVNRLHLTACKENIGTANPTATETQVDLFCRGHIKNVTGAPVL